MSYHFTRVLDAPFEEAISHVTAVLAEQGFGVLTTIDVKATLKKKLDVDFRPYTILGTCNPEFAYKALQCEGKIGTMLPCNGRGRANEGGTRRSLRSRSDGVHASHRQSRTGGDRRRDAGSPAVGDREALTGTATFGGSPP